MRGEVAEQRQSLQLCSPSAAALYFVYWSLFKTLSGGGVMVLPHAKKKANLCVFFKTLQPVFKAHLFLPVISQEGKCEDTLQRQLGGWSAGACIPVQDGVCHTQVLPPGLHRGSLFSHLSEQFWTPPFLWGEHTGICLQSTPDRTYPATTAKQGHVSEPFVHPSWDRTK